MIKPSTGNSTLLAKVASWKYKWLKHILLSFRLYTDSEETSYGFTFIESSPNSLYGSVFHKNMDETSFTGFDLKIGLKKTLANPKTAYFGSIGDISTQHEFKSCQVLVV